jgi:hypothetical protein
VLLRIFNLPVKKDNIGSDGSCHDLGNGPHISTEYCDVVGWRWNPTEFKYKFCIPGHYNNLKEVKKTYPDIKIVLIKIDDDDIDNVSRIRLQKILVSDYDKFLKKFNITNWPTLTEVLDTPTLIDDSFRKYNKLWTKEWINDINLNLVDIIIPFKSVYGINDISLESLLEEKFSISVDPEVSQFIKNYQEKNKEYIIS